MYQNSMSEMNILRSSEKPAQSQSLHSVDYIIERPCVKVDPISLSFILVCRGLNNF